MSIPEDRLRVSSEVLLTKATGPSTRAAREGGEHDRRRGDPISEQIRHRSVRRLEVAALLMFTVQLVVGLAVNLIQGTLADEFRSLGQWGFTGGVALVSLAMVLLIRTKRIDPVTIVRLGLAYQVVISFGIAGGLYFGAFEGVAAEEIRFDRIGMTFVSPWMLLFSVLVPAPPRESLVALLASATAVPFIYLVQVSSKLAPALPIGTFGLIFVLPYLVTAALSYVASRIVHELGVEVRRAYEMGSYRLETLLGRGRMGEVWRATHRTLARPAAIKLIRPEAFGEEPAVADARFEREAQAIASLESPNTIALYDFGATQDGTLYYVMELLDGVDLEELVKRYGPLPAERVAHILRRCARHWRKRTPERSSTATSSRRTFTFAGALSSTTWSRSSISVWSSEWRRRRGGPTC